jgi:DnaJ family protein A protein 5
VDFVKKRDIRWKRIMQARNDKIQAQKMNERSGADSKKSYRSDKNNKKVLDRLSDVFEEQDWMKVDEKIFLELEENIMQMELNPTNKKKKYQDTNIERETYNYDEEDNIYCVACDKFFQSKMQFDNHERSTKHKKQLQQLKKQLLEDDNGCQYAESLYNDSENDEKASKEKSDEEKTSFHDILDDATDRVSYSDDNTHESSVEKNKNEDYSSSPKKTGSKKKLKKNLQKRSDMNLFTEIYETIEERLDTQNEDTLSDFVNPESTSIKEEAASPLKKKDGKKSKKTYSKDLQCHVCGLEFISRNQLFRHVNEKGHALASRLFDQR